MTQEEILKRNEAIALFMGVHHEIRKYTNNPDDKGIMIYFFPDAGTKETYLLDAKELPYNTRWDWLMPVVEKIESIENSDDYEVDIFSNCCEIGCKDEHSAVGKTKIEAVWQAVIQFILWYNQNNK